ncbi:MAG: acyl-ACP--UDP-N-acetylglucosamine O-acyltransferase [Planctomycetota bacterium]
MPEIHPLAVVDPKATLGEGVRIGPFCQVGPKAILGAGTRLVSHVNIMGRTTLGENNTVWPNAVLGGDPQDLKFGGEDSQLVIGSHNEIRESVTLHKGTENDHGITTVGDHNLLMAYCHLGHDGIIGNHCVIANSVNFAGHVKVEDHVIIGGGAAVHHYSTIGQHAFIGGFTRCVNDIPPFMVTEGSPYTVRGVNSIGLSRRGFSADTIAALKDAWKRLYRAKNNGRAGNTVAALQALEDAYPHESCILALAAHIRRSAEGSFGRYRESFRHDNPRTAPAK